MSVQDKGLDNLYGIHIFVMAGRLLVIATLVISLILVLAREGIYGAATTETGLVGNAVRAVSAVSDADDSDDESEAIQTAAPVTVSLIRPDMDAAGRFIDGVSNALAFFYNDESLINNDDITRLSVGGGSQLSTGNDAGTTARSGAGISSSADASLPVNSDTYMPSGADARLLAGGGMLNMLFSALYDFSVGVADAHQTRLDARADSLAYASQISAAKYLAQSAYRIAYSERQAFIDENGMSAADMSDKEISRLYNNNYFQDRLKEMGFYKEDKYSGDVNRRNAIIRAQSAFNIPITAKIDLNTKRALIKDSDFVPKDIITGEHPDGMWVVIDKSARILTVYIDETVFKKYPVAVGASIALTPEGQFTFVSKAVNPRWGGGGYASPIAGGAPNNPLGKRWMGLSKGGGGQYGVHGNVSPYSIGTNASHGCVRMINSDVEELYEYIKIGTPVWIGTTAKLAEWGISQQLGSWEPDLPNYLDYMSQSAYYEE